MKLKSFQMEFSVYISTFIFKAVCIWKRKVIFLIGAAQEEKKVSGSQQEGADGAKVKTESAAAESSGPVAETFRVIRGAVTEEYVRSTRGVFQFDLSGKTMACAALPSKRHRVFSNRGALWKPVPKQTGCSCVLCDAPAPGPLEQALGAAGPRAAGAAVPALPPRTGPVWPQTGRSRGHGRRAGCPQLCGQGAACGLSRPRPQHVVALGASRGTRGDSLQSVCQRADCHGTAANAHGCGRLGQATEREGTAALAAFSPGFTLCPGDGGGTWYIDLKTEGGSAGFGKPPVAADVVMSMSSADFVKMFTGEGQRPLSRDAGPGAQKSLCWRGSRAASRLVIWDGSSFQLFVAQGRVQARTVWIFLHSCVLWTGRVQKVTLLLLTRSWHFSSQKESSEQIQSMCWTGALCVSEQGFLEVHCFYQEDLIAI